MFSLHDFSLTQLYQWLKHPGTYVSCLTILFSLLSYSLAKRFLPSALIRLLSHRQPEWRKIFKKQQTFQQLVYMVPVLSLYFTLQYFPDTSQYLQRILNAYLMLNLLLLFGALLNTAQDLYALYPIAKEKPIKSYLQLFKLFLYLIGAVLVICVLLNKELLPFISGIGALTAILLLVFRDTLLSFIASMQIAANHLIRTGDWIEIPQYGANGNVIDVALHVIKIQNFDKTIVSVPTYKLTEMGFKNWRGMYESGGRRIKRALMIDQSSLRFLSDADQATLRQQALLKPYLDGQQALVLSQDQPIQTISAAEQAMAPLTNLSLFRQYVKTFLKTHPYIAKDMTFLVRLLDPTPAGVPLELYVFSNQTDWILYEHIQSTIFEHLMAVMPLFGLKIFQYAAWQPEAQP